MEVGVCEIVCRVPGLIYAVEIDMGREERIVNRFNICNTVLCEDYKRNIGVGTIQFGDRRPRWCLKLCVGEVRSKAIS